MESSDHDSLTKTIQGLQRNVQSLLQENLANTRRNHRNDLRTLALLKALAGEIVLADPSARARMHVHLDEMLLLYGNDSVICDSIKEAIKIVSAA